MRLLHDLYVRVVEPTTGSKSRKTLQPTNVCSFDEFVIVRDDWLYFL